MLTDLRSLLIAAVFITTSCASSLAEEGFSSPQALLNEIYGHYKDGKNVDTGDPKVVERYFVADIAAKMTADYAQAAAMGEVPILDGDAFLDAQDFEITDLAIAIAKSSTPNTTLGYVTFKNFGEEKKITLSLQKTAKGWQIADIDYQGEQKLSDLYGLKR